MHAWLPRLTRWTFSPGNSLPIYTRLYVEKCNKIMFCTTKAMESCIGCKLERKLAGRVYFGDWHRNGGHLDVSHFSSCVIIDLFISQCSLSTTASVSTVFPRVKINCSLVWLIASLNGCVHTQHILLYIYKNGQTEKWGQGSSSYFPDYFSLGL